MTTIYHATVTYQPEYWSHVCACRIPSHWSGEVILKQTDHSLSRACADGATKADVVTSLIDQLKSRGLHGVLRLS